MSTERQARDPGFTLVELLVAIGIFLIMGSVLLTTVSLMLDSWRTAERTRKSYEAAQMILSQMTLDLEAAFTLDPVHANAPTARLFCTRDAGTLTQRLDFVRTFEMGPEKALTFYAGSNRKKGATYTDDFTGDPMDLGPIDGLLGVSYFVRGRELRRATTGPPVPPGAGGSTATTAGSGEVLSRGCLHLGFRFWTQLTTDWASGPPGVNVGRGGTGPETVWDSTRGLGVADTLPGVSGVRPFSLTVGASSLRDPSDDVFPEIVEVTLVLDPESADAVRTTLVEPMSEAGDEARVATTRRFGEPEFVLIGDEWVKVKGVGPRRFVLSARGQRWTPARAHPVGAEVRLGQAFVKRIHVPAYRVDAALGRR